MKIQLQRHIGYHLVQTYIPSVVFVVLSWLALFISADSIPGKFLLVLLLQKRGINYTLQINHSMKSNLIKLYI